MVNMTEYGNINVGKNPTMKEQHSGATLPEIYLKCIQDDYVHICKVGQRKMKSVELGLKSFASPLCFLLLTSNSISYSMCSFHYLLYSYQI